MPGARGLVRGTSGCLCLKVALDTQGLPAQLQVLMGWRAKELPFHGHMLQGVACDQLVSLVFSLAAGGLTPCPAFSSMGQLPG